MQALVSLLAGVLFGVGLGVAGMTNPGNVRAFLDIFGAWDPTLMFVMAGGIAVHMAALQLIAKHKTPLFEPSFHQALKHGLDAKLLIGAGIFGVGWGIAGFCPGPAIVSLGSGAMVPLVFVAAMTAGMLLQHVTGRRDQALDAGGDTATVCE